MQVLVERLTGIKFRNKMHFGYAVSAFLIMAVATAAVVWQPFSGIAYSGLGSIHALTAMEARQHVRNGTRPDAFSPDCIWFNGTMAAAYLGLFAILLWGLLR